ncbi:MAG: hypothetical protein QOJ60_456 [Actinomycetota bacterium]|nr:hypothetical protein [Actinomycetota bacterium]
MSRRLVAVLVAARPTLPDRALRMAMAEDCYETVACLELVEPLLAVAERDPDAGAVDELAWPGTVVLRTEGPVTAANVLRRLAGLGADEATVVAADAPDLPGLLLGKLHRALGSSPVAVLPAAGGGLVALAARCPLADWLEAATLDADDALDRLRGGAPRRTSVSVGPGWHRVRRPEDVDQLDPGLEGWEVTRAALRAAAP